MRRLIVLILLGVAGGWALWWFANHTQHLAVHGGAAFRTGEAGTYMIALTIDNSGAPETLKRVSSPGALSATVAGQTGAVVIPGGGSVSFSMDGAHLMVRGVNSEGLIPLTLEFASGATLTTRVKHAATQMMDHSTINGVETTPAPSLSISVTGAILHMETGNFALKRVADDADPVAGEGHAHVYLNGVKLGRLYNGTMNIGTLPPGTYEVRVALNTHDHRPYLHNGEPVSKTIAVTVP